MYFHKFTIKLQSTSVTSQYFFWIFLLVFCAWWALLHAYAMSSSEKRDLLYEKAKEFWRSRKKHVRLNVPKHLDVEAEISKDLRRLASFDFQPDELPQSEVTCETYNSLFTVTRKLKFGEITLFHLNLGSFSRSRDFQMSFGTFCILTSGVTSPLCASKRDTCWVCLWTTCLSWVRKETFELWSTHDSILLIALNRAAAWFNRLEPTQTDLV